VSAGPAVGGWRCHDRPRRTVSERFANFGPIASVKPGRAVVSFGPGCLSGRKHADNCVK